MSLLQVAGIGKRSLGTAVLEDISFTLEKGQHLGIMGETGSGKSTLLKIIGGRDQASFGTVLFKGALVQGIEEKLLPGHPGIAYLSQQHNLPQHLRVEQVLEYAANDEVTNPQELYELCRIDHLLRRKTHQLSGGEQQRVATACLLLNAPQLLLLDEPFSNLDVIHKALMKHILAEAESRLGFATILVSHDPQDLLPWSDRLLLLQHGSTVQEGSPEKLYRQPVTEYAAALLGAYTLLHQETLSLFGLVLPDGFSGALVRPEGFAVVLGEGVCGTVTAVQFMGGGYRLLVTLLTQDVLVDFRGTAPSVGTSICLTLSSTAVHFI
jgi:iron(III) transport system ATP-binding protein